MFKGIFVFCMLLVSCTSHNTTRPEIDLLKLDTKWSLSQVQEYMNGKYCMCLPDYDSNGSLHSLRFAPVYYQGVQGSFFCYKYGRDLSFNFFSPLRTDKYFSIDDTSSCFEKGALPSREYYEKLKEYLIKKYPHKSIHGDENIEFSTLEDSSRRITLGYQKRNRIDSVEAIYIEIIPGEYTK